MSLETSLLTLLHLLVFAYWLGGDIGVFYASTLLTDDKRETAGRLAAGKIVADVDLAPRFCLLLTAPTGFALATAKGWVQFSPLWIALMFAAAFVWIFIVWRLHVGHGKPDALKQADTWLRYLLLAVLSLIGVAGLTGVIALPAFLAIKLLVLGFAVLMGLIVRRVFAPFAPAYAKLASEGPSAETNQTIRSALNRARPAVIAIWVALAFAAWLGVATPT